ncbi:MAG: hypothetical protein ACRDC4_14055 [Plesiomonas sp.]
MFDVIGYWGVLTALMMFPIVCLAWLFTEFTNKRIKELGGKPVKMFDAFDKLLDKSYVGVPLVIGTFFGVVLSCVWAIGNIVKDEWFTYIGFFSKLSENLSPVSGYVLTLVVVFIAYDVILKGYVRVTTLVEKLDAKSE